MTEPVQFVIHGVDAEAVAKYFEQHGAEIAEQIRRYQRPQPRHFLLSLVPDWLFYGLWFVAFMELLTFVTVAAIRGQ